MSAKALVEVRDTLRVWIEFRAPKKGELTWAVPDSSSPEEALEALRRDRSGISRFFVDLVALTLGLVSRKFLVIDDHMIWNYRVQLEAIAAARADPARRTAR